MAQLYIDGINVTGSFNNAESIAYDENKNVKEVISELSGNLDKKLELSTITCSAINGSTLYYGVLQNVGKVVHFQYDIELKSGTTIDNTVALAKFSKGCHAVNFIIPCILRNAGSGATKQSFAIIYPNGELYPYETNSGYNEMRITGSYCTS